MVAFSNLAATKDAARLQAAVQRFVAALVVFASYLLYLAFSVWRATEDEGLEMLDVAFPALLTLLPAAACLYAALHGARRLWLRTAAVTAVKGMGLSAEQCYAYGLPLEVATVAGAPARAPAAPAAPLVPPPPVALASVRKAGGGAPTTNAALAALLETPSRHGRTRRGSATGGARPADAADALPSRALGLPDSPSRDADAFTAALHDSAAQAAFAPRGDYMGLGGALGAPSVASTSLTVGPLPDVGRARYLEHEASRGAEAAQEAARQRPAPDGLQYLMASPSSRACAPLSLPQWARSASLPPRHALSPERLGGELERLSASLCGAVARHFAGTYLPRLRDSTASLQERGGAEAGSDGPLLPTAFLERRVRGTSSTGAEAGRGTGYAGTAFGALFGPPRTGVSSALAAFPVHSRCPSLDAMIAEPTDGARDMWEARADLDRYLWAGSGFGTSAATAAASPSGRSSGAPPFDVRGYALARLEDLTGVHLRDGSGVKRAPTMGGIAPPWAPVPGKLVPPSPSDPALSSYLGDDVALLVSAGAEGEGRAGDPASLLPTDGQVVLHYWCTMMDAGVAAAAVAGDMTIVRGGAQVQPALRHRLFSSQFVRAGTGGEGGGEEGGAAGAPPAGSKRGGEEHASRRIALQVGRERPRLRPSLLVDGTPVDLSRSLSERAAVPGALALFALLQLDPPGGCASLPGPAAGMLLPKNKEALGPGTLCIGRGAYVNLKGLLEECAGEAARTPAQAVVQSRWEGRPSAGPYGAW
jgi:hypothetical protein